MKKIGRAFYAYMSETMKGTSKAFYVFIAVLGVVFLWGSYNWFLMLTRGHGLSGLSDAVPWGIFISGLALFIGLSAGATIVGLLIHGFGREDYAPMGTRAILLALLCIFGATQFVLVDLGVPLRGLKVPWILHNPTSIFLLSSSSYYVFMVILSGELYYTIKTTLGKASHRDEKIAKWLGILAVPYALWVVHAFTGSIFGVVKAREMWNTPILPVHFVISALASGFALVILVAILTSKIQKKELLSAETYDHMGKLLAFFVLVTIFLDFFDHFIIKYSAKKEAVEVWEILTSRYAPVFALNISGLIAAFIILLFKKGRTTKGLLVATILTLLAVLAYRIYLISVGQLVPLYPGMGELYYHPTFTEISVALGLIALLTFLYLVLSKILPMEEKYHRKQIIDKRR